MKKILLTATLIACSGAAFSAGSKASGDIKKDSDVVCRNVAETGSRLSSKKVCMTRAQWAEHKRNTRRELNDAQSRRLEASSN